MNHFRICFLVFLILMSGFVAVGQPSRFKITYSHNNAAEWAMSVLFLSDSSLLVNSMFNTPTERGILLINVNQSGTVVSTKTHSRPNRIYSGSWAGSLLNIDSNFYVGGEYHIPNLNDPSNNFAFPSLVKFDRNGDTIWAKHYDFDTSAYYQASSCIKTSDGGILLCGAVAAYDNYPGIYDYYVIKTDTSGNLLWQKRYGFDFRNEHGSSIAEFSDGRLLISGVILNPSITTAAPWVIITNDTGAVLWQRIYLNPSLQWGGAYAKPVGTSGFFLAGMTDTVVNLGDHPQTGYIAKADSNGDFLWHSIFSSKQRTSLWDFHEIDDGQLIFCGDQIDSITGKPTGYIAKVDKHGILNWWRSYHENLNAHAYLSCVRPAPDGGFVALGSAYPATTPTSQDAWIIKTDSLGCIVSNCHLAVDDIPKQFNKLSCFPNPADQLLEIRSDEKGLIKVFDLLGREIIRTESDGHVQVNTSNWVNGTYIITLHTARGVVLNLKVIVEH